MVLQLRAQFFPLSSLQRLVLARSSELVALIVWAPRPFGHNFRRNDRQLRGFVRTQYRMTTWFLPVLLRSSGGKLDLTLEIMRFLKVLVVELLEPLDSVKPEKWALLYLSN